MARLDPMTPEEYRAFLEWIVPEYANDHVRAGRWRPNDALERSRAEFDQLLPQGVETADHFLRTIHDEQTGTRVGEVWYALRELEGWPMVFVYWIGILKDHRRKGYAAQAFREIESEAKKLGAERIALHVFSDNEGAIAFYRQLGYIPTDLIMSKRVE